jgi:3-methyladenine DNA glycosylase AlkD
MLRRLRAELQRHANPERAAILQRFFKTGPGEYAAGDKFIGLTVPQIRALAKRYRQLSLADTCRLLHSPVHEERLLALLLLVQAYRAGTEQQRIYELYLQNTRYINNWDLVDCSAEHIVGAFLRERSRSPLQQLAKSENLWERRIAILATFHFIKRGEFAPTLQIGRQLLRDEHDLIHKAVGWMLREVGKRDRATEETFLRQHYRQMPRTMLRYAIERFPETLRQRYLRRAISCCPVQAASVKL